MWSSEHILMDQTFDRHGDRKDWRELKNPCYGEIEEIEDDRTKRFRLFNNFDVVEYPPCGHRFIANDHRNDIYQTDARRSIIHREWEILKDTLPGSSIFVRVYRTRLDLMRVVIVGPEGTPYCNGLFFFDVLIPSKYPSQPPEIGYLYYGVEINPYRKPVFIELCKSMLDMLKHPPKDFRVLVEGHFRNQSHSILMMYKAIMESHSVES